MGATSKERVRDHAMHTRSKQPLGDAAMGARSTRRLPYTANCVHAGMRAVLLQLGCIAALICLAQPAPARVMAKKGAYGAIALQRETGQVGYAYNAATSRAAKMEALNQCTDPRCEVVVNFRNACGALARQAARGPKSYFPATGAVRQEAETKALRLCAARECEILAWACTK
jgi:serine/threonine-protein kinase